MPDTTELHLELERAAACTLCAATLPLGPRPIFRITPTARILIISQAPGTKAHLSGVPFNDASGIRLRAWLNMNEAQFYDATRVAIMPMGFCYPGVLPKGGDKPPMPVCATTWHARLLKLMPELRLTLLVGSYAQAAYLGRGAMSDRVRDHRLYLPTHFPLPHPSWRTVGWEARNPWFTADVLPALRTRLEQALST